MKSNELALLVVFAFGTVTGCSDTPTKSPDVSDSIKRSLDQSGLKDVSVSQDRDKGVVTLTGSTASEADKSQAEAIATSIAGAQVVSDKIAVRPPGYESAAKRIDSDLDDGIAKNFDAVLVGHKLDRDVKCDVKNGVVTL